MGYLTTKAEAYRSQITSLREFIAETELTAEDCQLLHNQLDELTALSERMQLKIAQLRECLRSKKD